MGLSADDPIFSAQVEQKQEIFSFVQNKRVEVMKILKYGLLILIFVMLGCRSQDATTVFPTDTPLITATISPVLTPSAEPTVTLTQQPTRTKNPTATQKPMATKESTFTPAPTDMAEATPVPTDMPVPTDTAEAPVPTDTPVPTEEATPVIYRNDFYTVIGLSPDDTLNLRTGPGVQNPIVAKLDPATHNIRMAQGESFVNGSTWVFINVEEQLGWVNLSFLAVQEGRIESAVLRRLALRVAYLLRNHDLVTIAEIAHPKKGVRFAPQSFLSEADLIFSAEEVANLWDDPVIYQWGYSMGEGAPLLMTFQDYYEQFVYSADYLFADRIGYGITVSHATTVENSLEIYPDATMIEYHFDGFNPQYEGLDWRTLRLLFEEDGDNYYLVAVIFSAWSP